MSLGVDRRDFLRVLASVGAGAAAAACNTPRPQHLRANFEPPEDRPTGAIVYYATTCRECPAGCGVWARSLEGRTIKVEGNPHHPISHGALCARGQAAPQALYNPDRVTKPLARGEDGQLHEVSWQEALRRLNQSATQLLADGRGKSVAWLTGEISDSDADLVEMFARETGMPAPVNLRLFSETPQARAAQNLFGYRGVPELHLEEATLIVALGADFAESWGNPVAQIHGFTRAHAYREGVCARVIYLGPRQSTTASICDAWIPLAPGREAAALRVMLEGVLARKGAAKTPPADLAAAKAVLAAIPLAEAESSVGGLAPTLRQLGEDLAAAKAPLVFASGLGPDAELAHSLALLATHLAGGSGRTIHYPNPGRAPRGNALEEVHKSLDDAAGGATEALLIQEANPAFLLPGAAEALRKAPFVACFTTQFDETAALAHLVVPIHHSLESWGDHAAAAGVVGLLQPTMPPLFGTRAFADVVLTLAEQLRAKLGPRLAWPNAQRYMDARFRTWHRTLGVSQPFDDFAREAKKRGVLARSLPETPVALRGDVKLPALRKAETGLLAWFYPHVYHYDGRGADKGWLQEVPETSTAIVWGSWAEIHPDTARELGIGQSDLIALARGNAEIRVPAHVTEEVMPGVVAVAIGQGHEQLGRLAAGRGANPLRLTDPSSSQGSLAPAGFVLGCRRTGEKGSIVSTVGSQDQGKRGLAQIITLEEARKGGGGAEQQPTLYAPIHHPDHQWAMVIDLDACVGCGACAVACYAENNVPVVGDWRVAQGREMAWIHLEKYVKGRDVRLLVSLCQHCHDAPCEPVCPVFAAHHTVEGLNAQVYNRCVGTRYCSNNCPYKARRFNWFDYKVDPPLQLQLNPYVTVRERGMMEKCSFCVQRIRDGRQKAKREGRPVRDGEIAPACVQTCPAGVFTFGDLKDPTSRVSRLVRDPRGYRLLGDLGTAPSILYLKKVVRG